MSSFHSKKKDSSNDCLSLKSKAAGTKHFSKHCSVFSSHNATEEKAIKGGKIKCDVLQIESMTNNRNSGPGIK